MNTRLAVRAPHPPDESVRVLSRLRRGELSVMSTYSKAIAKGGTRGKHLAELRCGHEAAAAALHRRVTDLGGTVDATGGFWESFSGVVRGATTMLRTATTVETLRLGERHGVVGYAKALANQRVDPESWQQLRVAFARQQASLGALEGLVGPR